MADWDPSLAKRLWLDGWSERDVAYALGISRRRVRTLRKNATQDERDLHRAKGEQKRVEVESDVVLRRIDHRESYRTARSRVSTNKRLGLKARFDPSYEENLMRQLKKWGSP